MSSSFLLSFSVDRTSRRYISLSLSFIQTELAFDEIEESLEFLTAHSSSCFVDPHKPESEKLWDCKAALPRLAQVFESKYRKVGIKGAI